MTGNLKDYLKRRSKSIDGFFYGFVLHLQDGKTPLHLAATNGHSDTVSALIMNGADISAQDLVGLLMISIILINK